MTRIFIASLVAEVAHAGEDHREAEAVGRGDHFFVTYGAAWLCDRGGSGLGGERGTIGEREQRFRNEHRSLKSDLEARGLLARGVNRIDSRSRTAADRERAIFLN